MFDGAIKDVDSYTFVSGQTMIYAATSDRIFFYNLEITEKRGNNDVQIFSSSLQIPEEYTAKDITSIAAIPSLKMLAYASKSKGLVLIKVESSQ